MFRLSSNLQLCVFTYLMQLCSLQDRGGRTRNAVGEQGMLWEHEPLLCIHSITPNLDSLCTVNKSHDLCWPLCFLWHHRCMGWGEGVASPPASKNF